MSKALLKDTLVYGGVDFFFKFINFALFPLYAFLLPVSEFGILALITTLTTLLCIIMNCGQTQALQRFYGTAGVNATKTGFVCFGVIGIVITLIALGIPYLLNEQQFSLPLLLLGIMAAWPFQVYQYSVASLRINFQTRKFVFLNLLQNGCSILLSLILAFYFQLGLLGFLSAIVMANFISACFCFFKFYRNLEGCFDSQLARQMVVFGIPFVFTDLTNWLYASLDRWMLGELASSAEVGYYSIAFKLSTLIIFFINAFGAAWSPHVMKLYHEDPNYKSFIGKSLTRWFYFLVCVASMLILFNKELLMLTTPSAYWPASQLIPWVSIGLAFHGTLVLSTTGLFIEKKTIYLTVGTWLGALLNFMLNLKLIPHLGAYGSAMACMLTYMFQAAYYLYYSQKFHYVPLEHNKLLLCAAMLFGVLAVSQTLDAETLLIQIAVKMGVFAGILFAGGLLKLISLQELKQNIKQWSLDAC